MKSCGVTILMKPLWQYFHMVPFVFAAFYLMKTENRCQNFTLVITFGSERVTMLLEVFLVRFDSLSGAFRRRQRSK